MKILSHIEKHDDLYLWVTFNSNAGVSFKYDSLDAENFDDETVIEHLKTDFAKISEKVSLRFHTKTYQDNSIETYHGRSEAAVQIGQTRHESILSIETFSFFKINKILFPFSKDLRGDLNNKLDLIRNTLHELDLKSVGINLTSLNEAETKALFEAPDEVLKYRDFISFKTANFGAVRMKSLKSVELNCEILADIRARLPKPYELSVSMRKLDSFKTEFILRGKKEELNSMESINLSKKRIDVEQSIDDIVAGGESQFNVEFIVGITRPDEISLKKDLKIVENILSSISHPYIESIGTYPTWESMREGAFQRVKFQEQSTGVALLLPIFSFGDANCRISLNLTPQISFI